MESVIERLNLCRELVHVRATVGLLFLQCALKIGHRRGDFVHAVSALLDQVFHDPHALVEGLLHVRHLVLKSLYLSLQLDDLPANAMRTASPATAMKAKQEWSRGVGFS